MFKRIRQGVHRSWVIMPHSGRVLKRHRQALLYPLCSFIFLIIVTRVGIMPLFRDLVTSPTSLLIHKLGSIVLLFSFYLLVSFVITLANTAMILNICRRLNQEVNNIKLDLIQAWQVLIPILHYSLLTATVNTIYLALRIVTGLVIGFILAPFIGNKLLEKAHKHPFLELTLMALPVVALEKQGLQNSLERARILLSQTWGPSVRQTYSHQLFLFLILLPVSAIVLITLKHGISVQDQAFVLASGQGLLWLILMTSQFGATLDAIYGLAAYRFAIAGHEDVYQFPNFCVQAFSSPTPATSESAKLD